MNTMRRIAFVLIMVLMCAFPLTSWAGDTGTYDIINYEVTLIPHYDGLVDIEYHQTWKVTGGHIPWITIGVPNSNNKIVSFGKTVKTAKNEGGGGSWVRLDLDRDYQSGETFDVELAIKQNNLFYAKDKDYKMDFTPGWYDRAFTSRLAITMKFFADMKTVKAEPKPDSTTEDTMTWEKKDLGKGQKMSISIAFPQSQAKITKENLKSETSIGTVFLIILIIVIIIVVIVTLIGVFGGDGGYSGGGIFYGGSGSGGGGAGGRGFSCACACVSCACACACAGGGAAGCSRKAQHKCEHCQPTKHGGDEPCAIT